VHGPIGYTLHVRQAGKDSPEFFVLQPSVPALFPEPTLQGSGRILFHAYSAAGQCPGEDRSQVGVGSVTGRLCPTVFVTI